MMGVSKRIMVISLKILSVHIDMSITRFTIVAFSCSSVIQVFQRIKNVSIM